MKFLWSTLRVKDLDASIKFYEQIVGLSVTRRFASGSGSEIAFMGGAGDTEVELISDDSDRETSVGSDISWGFEVDSLAEMITKLDAAGITYEGPRSPNPNISFIFINDPDRMRIQFAENL